MKVVRLVIVLLGTAVCAVGLPGPGATASPTTVPVEHKPSDYKKAFLTDDEARKATGSAGAFPPRRYSCFEIGCSMSWPWEPGNTGPVFQDIREFASVSEAKRNFRGQVLESTYGGNPTVYVKTPTRLVYDTYSSTALTSYAVQRRGRFVIRAQCEAPTNPNAHRAQCASSLLTALDAKVAKRLG